jgi:uncharacterized protein YabN with tetrapyrrole methylase and pyrophosphatase domain
VELGDPSEIKEEVGDVLFTALNIARFLEIDPETALNKANCKFESRFKAMEEFFSSQERPLKEVDTTEMEEFWQNNKSENNLG